MVFGGFLAAFAWQILPPLTKKSELALVRTPLCQQLSISLVGGLKSIRDQRRPFN